MVETHIFEDPEIDAQHEVIYAQVSILQEVLSGKEQPHIIQPTLRRLHELLVAHFEKEESFMNEHRQKHRDMLDLLEQCLASSSVAGEAGPLEQLFNDNQSGQIGDYDARMPETIKQLIDSIRTHELRNPNMVW